MRLPSNKQAELKENGGFTLVELMVAVAIIGILAAIAIPSYKHFRAKSKTTEAKMNLAAIRTAEELYAAETDSYVFAGPSPATFAAGKKTPWKPSKGMEIIGFAPAGDVYYSYAVGNQALTEENLKELTGGSIGTVQDGEKIEALDEKHAQIFINAIADLDGDGQKACYTMRDNDTALIETTPGQL